MISVRSHLLAGTVAMVTATAVTATGMTANGIDLPSARISAAASVTMAAYASPLLEIYDTIQNANTWMFSIATNPPLPIPPPMPFDYYGLVPDWLGAGFPILTQYALNASDYVNQTINYGFQDFPPQTPFNPDLNYPGALRLLTWAVDALPANVGYAANQLFSGNLVGVLTTAKFAIVNPIQAALYQTLNSGMYVVGGVLARAAAVISAVADWVPEAIRHAADDVTVVLNAAFDVMANVAYGIQTGNPETVWNSLVVGLLGTSPNPASPSIPDALINQTIGPGGRIYSTPTRYNDAPSIRQDLTDLRDKLKDALATDVPAPAIPPFPVNDPRFGPSYIPTPWQPTPNYIPPVAAVRSRAASAQVTAGPGSTASKATPRSAAARSISASRSTIGE